MESQRVNEASFSVGAKSSPMLDVFQNQGVDQYILAALINQEDRFYILELGMAFEALIMNQRAFMSLSFSPSYPSHYRQLAIFCAIYHNLMPDHDFLTGGLLVFKTASSRIPPIRLLDLAHPERIPPPPVHHQGWEEQPMDEAVVEHPLQPNIQSSDHLDVPEPQTSPLTPPQTPLPAINHLPASPPNPNYPSSTSPQKANSTVITNPSIALASDTTSTAPATTGGIDIRTCSRPLNPNAPPFVPAHLRTRTVAPQQPAMPPTWTPGVQTSSSTRRTRIDAKFLPNWRSSLTAGHGGLDPSLRSRRKLFAGSSSTSSGSSSVNFIDWSVVSVHSGASSP